MISYEYKHIEFKHIEILTKILKTIVVLNS